MTRTSSIGLVSLLAIVAIAVNVSLSQGPKPAGAKDKEQLAAAADKEGVKIRKFEGIGKKCLVKTPLFTTTVQRSAATEQDWMQISTTYQTTAEWVDELVFQYYVLAAKKEEGKLKFTLYKKAVKYMDVEKGHAHVSTVFLRPTALKRYGEVIASAVEIMSNGAVVESKSADERVVPLPADKWWTNPAVVEHKDLTVREGYLLNRAESPFNLINIDDYEVIK
jgi:hypothetical protein